MKLHVKGVFLAVDFSFIWVYMRNFALVSGNDRRGLYRVICGVDGAIPSVASVSDRRSIHELGRVTVRRTHLTGTIVELIRLPRGQGRRERRMGRGIIISMD